jgi:predicted RNase H-like HicB family nuclease
MFAGINDARWIAESIPLIMNQQEPRMKRDFYVYIERDEDGFFVGEVPQLRACYAQGRSLEELSENISEVIQLCLEDEESTGPRPRSRQ